MYQSTSKSYLNGDGQPPTVLEYQKVRSKEIRFPRKHKSCKNVEKRNKVKM